jgi:quercetin dioxygenase-like cupin family protein
MNDENILKVAYLSELIEHHPQSSYNGETLIKKKTAGIQLYAFEKDIEIGEGRSIYDSFIYILEGEAEYTIDGKIYNLKKGQTITIPAKVSQQLVVKERVKIMSAWFTPNKLRRKKSKK